MTIVSPLPAYCGREPGVAPVVPPLTPAQQAMNLQIEAVTVVMRHGDRTSFGWNMIPGSWSQTNCFPGDSAIWNCSLLHDDAPGHDDEPSTAANFPKRVYRKRWDPAVEAQPGNCAMGQLTTRGYEQQHANGQGIRTAYVGPKATVGSLLPEFLDTSGQNGVTFDEAYLHLRADDEPRTLMSAQAFMLGLYDPDQGQQLPVGQGARLKIHSRDSTQSVMTPNGNICPKSQGYLNEAEKSRDYVDYIRNTVNPLLVQLTKAIGLSTNLTLAEALQLWDCAHSHMCHSYPIPTGLATLFPALNDARTWLKNYGYLYPSRQEAGQAGMGFLLGEIINHIDAVISQKSGEGPFALYSGHDTTLMPLMMMLGEGDLTSEWWPYAHMGIFEIWRSPSNDLYIRAMSQEKVLSSLPGCNGNSLCKYEDFRAAAMKTLVPPTPSYDFCAPNTTHELAMFRAQRLQQMQSLF